MVVLPSDHHIDGQKDYLDTLSEAIEIANRRRGIVTIGITPTRPETGYGYIEMGERITSASQAYKIARFTEKPNMEVAKDFLLKGTYLWNSGMFVFRADAMLTKVPCFVQRIRGEFIHQFTPLILSFTFLVLPSQIIFSTTEAISIFFCS